MSGTQKGSPLLLGMLFVLAGLSIALIVMELYPVGIALLAVAVALLPSSWKALRASPGADDTKGPDHVA